MLNGLYGDDHVFKCTPHNDEERALVDLILGDFEDFSSHISFRSQSAESPCSTCWTLLDETRGAKVHAGSSSNSETPLVDSSWKLGFDVFASLFLGCFIDFGYLHWHGGIERLVIESPLVKGESTISNGICKDIVKEYGDRKSTFQQSEDRTLRHLSALIHNCQRRHEVEQQLRQSRGLPPNTPVLLPERVSNGITRDESDRAWAESLVKDRGEEMDSSNQYY